MTLLYLPDPQVVYTKRWHKLCQRFPQYAVVLQWTRACRLLHRRECYRLGWPTDSRPRARQHGIRRLVALELLEAINTPPTLFQLGRSGAALLSAGGWPTLYRAPPHPRTRASLALAAAWAVAFGTAVRLHRDDWAFAWHAHPFTGTTLRPDGLGGLGPRLHARNAASYAWLPQQTTAPVQSIALEVDRGTERRRALQARVQQWSIALDLPHTSQLPTPSPLVVWVTTGTTRRLATLRATWMARTAHPAVFTTVEHLTAADGTIDAWHARYCTVQAVWLSGEHLFVQ